MSNYNVSLKKEETSCMYLKHFKISTKENMNQYRHVGSSYV